MSQSAEIGARTWVAPLCDNQAQLHQMLAQSGHCDCRPGRTWWGRPKPLTHTERCRLRDAYVTEIELSLALVADALRGLTVGDVERFNAQMADTLAAGWRYLGASR